jgi:hypothetical protein
MGEVDDPTDRYWGAPTERWLDHRADRALADHFGIGGARRPEDVHHADEYVKKVCAR